MPTPGFRISGGQTLLAIVVMSTVAIAGVILLQVFNKDYAPVVTLSAPTLAVLVGLFHLDQSAASRTDALIQNQKQIAETVNKVEKQTNGALNTSLAIIQANSMNPDLAGAPGVPTNPTTPEQKPTEQEGF
jgi:uncharacterized membrane protein YfbV (UPF0208 family)